MLASIVVPAFNSEDSIAACLCALQAQKFPKEDYEIIVVDDGSTDRTAVIAGQFDIRLIRQEHGYEPAARNTGIRAAKGRWVAFTDADCVPTRNWLGALMADIEPSSVRERVLGTAGPILGYRPATPAERFVELSGGLDAERHVNHPTFPYAHLANVMYRREELLAVGGLDERYRIYPGPDLHHRLQNHLGGMLLFSPRAVVLHRHRASWKRYWNQQFGYGYGYAKLLLHYRNRFPWSLRHELQAWGTLAGLAWQAAKAGKGDPALLRRGMFIKQCAFRLGFASTYWSSKERRLWQDG